MAWQRHTRRNGGVRLVKENDHCNMAYCLDMIRTSEAISCTQEALSKETCEKKFDEGVESHDKVDDELNEKHK